MTRASTGAAPLLGWEALLAARDGGDARRARAFARFREVGFPTAREEDWRFTPVAALARAVFGPVPPLEPRALPVPVPAAAREAARLVFVDGRFVPALSRLEGLPPGLSAEPLAAAAAHDRDLLDRFPSAEADHAFAALNAALWEDGAVLRFGSGAEIADPVHLVFLSRGGRERVAFHPRVLVQAERGSRGTVLETWAPFGGSDGAPTLGNGFARFHVAANARLDHAKVLAESPVADHVAVLDVVLERDARFHGALFTLGGALGRTEVRALLAGPGASCQLDGLYTVDGRRHADHQVRVDHAVPHGTSRQLHKGILDGHGTAAFAGSVLVRPDAQHTDARQANHSLLLSPDAVADSKPSLEIFADDVKCAHGATVGRLDEEAVFYLRARGLEDRVARALLVRAFAAEALRRHVEALLAARAEGLA